MIWLAKARTRLRGYRLAGLGVRTRGPVRVLGSVTVAAPGVTLGNRCRVGHDVFFRGPEVLIGDDVFLNDGVYINHHVTVDDHVSIGQFCRLITGDHELGPTTHRAGKTLVAPIRIGEGAWLGAGVLVLPGVTIGPGCVIAAGAVVIKDCEPNGLYAGVPATFRRHLS